MSFIRTMFILIAVVFSGFTYAAVATTVDINSADAITLQTLDGVGPAKAQAIIEYRKANGPFKTADDLNKVKGIGDKTMQANRDKITVGKVAPAPGKKEGVAKD